MLPHQGGDRREFIIISSLCFLVYQKNNIKTNKEPIRTEVRVSDNVGTLKYILTEMQTGVAMGWGGVRSLIHAVVSARGGVSVGRGDRREGGGGGVRSSRVGVGV